MAGHEERAYKWMDSKYLDNSYKDYRGSTADMKSSWTDLPTSNKVTGYTICVARVYLVK
jgi:hypothetical protein